MRILLVEPDEYYHAHFSEAVAPFGDLMIGRTAAEARTILRDFSPDALVMDLLLPDQSGYEFLQEIQELRERRTMPVIIFSRLTDLEDIQESLGYGVTGYFVKGQDSIQDVRNLLLNLYA